MATTEETTDQGTSGEGQGPPQSGMDWPKLMEVVQARKIDVALWATRLLTLSFALLYLAPLMGHPHSYYYKALLASAATSALRLHQRMPGGPISRAFIATLFMEDSCHYIFYVLLFMYCPPITLVLFPVTLFALLHFASFSLTLLDALGRNSIWIARLLIQLIDYHTATILRAASAAEIVIIVILVGYVMGGRAPLLSPFMYYRFITFRYASRRNHYTRHMFYELRMLTERFIMSGKCPGILAKILRWHIDLLCKVAPVPSQSPTN